MSRVNPELRTTVAQSVLRSHGYFNAQVSHEIKQSHNPKKARIGYQVNMGHLWTLDSIAYLGFPLGCDTLIQQSLPVAHIHKGDPFDVTTLSSERNRISICSATTATTISSPPIAIIWQIRWQFPERPNCGSRWLTAFPNRPSTNGISDG